MSKLFGGGGGPVPIVGSGRSVERTVFGVVVTVEMTEIRVVQSPEGTQQAIVARDEFKTAFNAPTMKEAASNAVQRAMNHIDAHLVEPETVPAE